MKNQKGEAITVFAVLLFLSFVGVSFVAADNYSKVQKVEETASAKK